MIAIAWFYIESHNIERILRLRLGLNSHLLPKSYAVGANADFIYSYDNNYLMIEVTLTQSYGIFIAPY